MHSQGPLTNVCLLQPASTLRNKSDGWFPNQTFYATETIRLIRAPHASGMDARPVRIHLIIEKIWWTGLAPWEIDFSFAGSLISTFTEET